ncbi:MAG: hypothetical protein FWE37_06000 [Spirochaetaceae bacterium]|nr:hypothetical protein [Spirochaetaceae bacterium]
MKSIKQKIKNKADLWLSNNLTQLMTKDNLTNLALNSTALGISSERYTTNEVVVSLTSYGKRLYSVHLAIESIMQQTLKPNKIVLWLGNELKNTPLPLVLQKQQQRGLEIKYCEDIKSYKKLIFSLKVFPQATIITIDDDCWYNYYLLENFLNEHKENPHLILAARMHRIKLNEQGTFEKYTGWGFRYKKFDVSPLNFPTGAGGILYPAGSFNDEIFNQEVFTKICPYADDVWFKAMALLNGALSKKIFTYNENGVDYISNEEVQDIGLWDTVNKSQNDRQLKAVFDRYDLYKKLILNN